MIDFLLNFMSLEHWILLCKAGMITFGVIFFISLGAWMYNLALQPENCELREELPEWKERGRRAAHWVKR